MTHIYCIFLHSKKVNQQYKSTFFIYFLTVLKGLLENDVQNISVYGIDRMHA
jgi:hypothetical protein